MKPFAFKDVLVRAGLCDREQRRAGPRRRERQHTRLDERAMARRTSRVALTVSARVTRIEQTCETCAGTVALRTEVSFDQIEAKPS